LVLDLEEVAMLDSSGIGLLARSLTATNQQGGSVKLLNPSKFATQTLKLLGILNLSRPSRTLKPLSPLSPRAVERECGGD
jgi:anti-anti-sigma factor